MKLKKTILLTAISMTLPASMLFAQDAAPQQPPQPPNAPQGLPPAQNGGQQQPGARPDGQRGGGQGDWHRRGPSLFELLDTNHDGVIDAEELKNAPEALKKLDRRGDGRITPDEFFPQLDGRDGRDGRFQRRPQDGNAQPGERPQAQPGQPGPQLRGDWNRRPGFDQGGPQAPRPNNGPNAQPQPPAPQPGGPGAAPQSPQDPQAWNQRRPQFPQEMRERFEREMRERFAGEMQRRQELAQRFGRDGQWQGRNNGPQQPGQPGPQWNQPKPDQQFSQNGQGGPQWGGRRHHGEFGPQQGQGFAQNRPQFGPQWGHHHHRGQFGPQWGQGFAQNRPQFGPQWGHHHHRGQFGSQWGQGFAQNRPQFGPQWGHKHHRGQFGSQWGQGFAQNRPQFGPQWGQRGPQGPQDFRRFSHRPQWQDGQRDFRRGPQFGPQQRGEFPRPDGRRFDGRGMNPQSAPGGPRPDDRNPAGNAPQHHHFHPGVTDNGAPEEGGAAGPQGEPAPEFQAPVPTPTDFGTSAAPIAPIEVI